MPQYSDIPVTPVYGPLSHQYPGIQPRLNLAVKMDLGSPLFNYILHKNQLIAIKIQQQDNSIYAPPNLLLV